MRELSQNNAINYVGHWVQTDRKGHEAFAQLVMRKPRAAALLHTLIAQMGKHNAVVTSQKILASMLKCHRNTVITALRDLQAGNWIEIRQIGDAGSVNAYIINDRIAWYGKRDGIRYSLFSANILISEQEQPDRVELESQTPLHKIPRVYDGEKQLPTGEGLPPPSQPFFAGMELDMPATREEGDVRLAAAAAQLIKNTAASKRFTDY
jgi:DNA-binding transcriptional MocR family regulator